MGYMRYMIYIGYMGYNEKMIQMLYRQRGRDIRNTENRMRREKLSDRKSEKSHRNP